MNRELTQLELQQLHQLIVQINEKISDLKILIENGVYITDKPIHYYLSFCKKKEKDNKLYLLKNLNFDFEKFVIPRLFKIYNTKINLHVINDDLSGVIVDCEDGSSYSKHYETQFKITIKR